MAPKVSDKEFSRMSLAVNKTVRIRSGRSHQKVYPLHGERSTCICHVYRREGTAQSAHVTPTRHTSSLKPDMERKEQQAQTQS